MRLSQLVQDGHFVAEVGRMGHGLQIWLQAIWFLVRSDRSQTLILDEPDVYLHADLQRKLIRHLLTLPNQTILTSHSVEILSEVAPDQILIVKPRDSRLLRRPCRLYSLLWTMLDRSTTSSWLGFGMRGGFCYWRAKTFICCKTTLRVVSREQDFIGCSSQHGDRWLGRLELCGGVFNVFEKIGGSRGRNLLRTGSRLSS